MATNFQLRIASLSILATPLKVRKRWEKKKKYSTQVRFSSFISIFVALLLLLLCGAHVCPVVARHGTARFSIFRPSSKLHFLSYSIDTLTALYLECESITAILHTQKTCWPIEERQWRTNWIAVVLRCQCFSNNVCAPFSLFVTSLSAITVSKSSTQTKKKWKRMSERERAVNTEYTAHTDDWPKIGTLLVNDWCCRSIMHKTISARYRFGHRRITKLKWYRRIAIVARGGGRTTIEIASLYVFIRWTNAIRSG